MAYLPIPPSHISVLVRLLRSNKHTFCFIRMLFKQNKSSSTLEKNKSNSLTVTDNLKQRV